MVRDTRLDFLKAAAILLVLVIHTSCRYLNSPVDRQIGPWFSMIAKPAVPLFLFVTGALFKTGQNYPYLLRRLRRMIIPYLLFALLAILYTNGISGSFYLQHLPDILFQIALGGTFAIYYYVFVAVFILVFAFLLDKLIDLDRHITLILILSIGAAVIHNLTAQIILDQAYVAADTQVMYLYRSPFIWLPFFFLGLFYQKKQLCAWLVCRKKWIIAVWVAVFGLVNYLYFFTQINFNSYNALPFTVYSLATIPFLLTFNIQGRVVEFLSKHSYPLYLIHIFFVYSIIKITQQWPFWFWLVLFLLTLFGTILVIQSLKGVFRGKSELWIGA